MIENDDETALEQLLEGMDRARRPRNCAYGVIMIIALLLAAAAVAIEGIPNLERPVYAFVCVCMGFGLIMYFEMEDPPFPSHELVGTNVITRVGPEGRKWLEEVRKADPVGVLRWGAVYKAAQESEHSAAIKRARDCQTAALMKP